MLVLSSFYAVRAQERNITGKIVGADGNPVPVATIKVSGTTKGTVTDVEGNFSLSVSPGDQLVISSVGYVTQEIKIADQKSLKITLQTDAKQLGELVVTTALGVKKDLRSVGYAVSTIDNADMVKAGATLNPFTALYGKAAGVGIQIGSAGPTGGVDIKIRGAVGLDPSANTRPLFVVDGVILHDQVSSMASRGYDPLNSFDYGSGINDLNPEDIQSITILKGAKASILYGSEGANGVVLITTKNGSNARGFGVTVTNEESWEQPVNYIDFQNEYGSGESQYDVMYGVINGDSVRTTNPSRFNFGPRFDGKPIMFFDSTMIPYQAYPDNFMSLFRTGHSRNTNVALAGASEKGNMRLSFTNYDYQDIVENMWQKKRSISFNGVMNASKFAKFEVSANLYKIKTHNRRPNIGGIVAWGLNRDYPFGNIKDMYLDENGYQKDLDAYGLPTLANNLISYWWEQDQNSDIDDRTHLITSAKATLNFTSYLNLVTQAALDYTDISYTTENKVTRIDPNISGGKYMISRSNYQVANYQALLNFDKSFLSDRFHIFAYGGGSVQASKSDSIFASTAGNLGYPDWYSLNNQSPDGWPVYDNRGTVTGGGRGSDILYSVLGSAEFSWMNEFYLELQARNDWNSTLPPQNNSYFYPGASFNWNFSQRFHIPKLQFGKLRMSFGDVGRGAGRYFALPTYGLGRVPGGSAVMVDNPSVLFAGYLKPERTREFEIGFNTQFFDQDRLDIDFSFYNRNTYNQIMGVDLSNATGATSIRINAGNVRQWGYELALKGTPLLTPKYRWDLTFTGSNQQSKVIHLYPGITTQLINGFNSFRVVAEEGKRIGEIQMSDYQRDPQGNRIVGDNGLYQLDTKKLVNVGNVFPDIFGGLNSDFYLKGFDFHFGIDYRFGGKILSYSNYYLTGMGITKNTLKYRDEEHGGMAYYINQNNVKVAWQHDQPAPVESIDGRVYHDGLILKGVNAEAGSDGTTKYVSNDVIVSATTYYSTYIHDLSTDFQPDNLFRNDYIKVREISLSYSIPEKMTRLLGLQKLTFTGAIRNLFYLYKTLPNVDAESTQGVNDYVENSFYPATRTYTFGVTVSF